MRVFHKAAGSNSSASSPPLSQSRGNAGWRGHLEAFSLTSRSRWDRLQCVIDSAVALSGQVLETYGDGAGYCAGSAFICFSLRAVPTEPPCRVGYAFSFELPHPAGFSAFK